MLGVSGADAYETVSIGMGPGKRESIRDKGLFGLHELSSHF